MKCCRLTMETTLKRKFWTKQLIDSFSFIVCIKCWWPLKIQYGYRKECLECWHSSWYGTYRSIIDIVTDEKTLEIVIEIIQFLGTDPQQFFEVIGGATNEGCFLTKKKAKIWLPSGFRWLKDRIGVKRFKEKYPYVLEHYKAWMPIDRLTTRQMLVDFYDKNNIRKSAKPYQGEAKWQLHRDEALHQNDDLIKTAIHFFLQEYGSLLKWDPMMMDEKQYDKRWAAASNWIDRSDIEYLLWSAEIGYSKIKKIIDFYQYKWEPMKVSWGARRGIIYN